MAPQGAIVVFGAPNMGAVLRVQVLANGIATERHEGTPQGGPLSPLLANVLLDEVDKELEKRGHAFLRAIHLKHWKRGTTIFRELRARGLPIATAAKVASNGRRCWRNSAMLINIAFPMSYFDQLGVPRLAS